MSKILGANWKTTLWGAVFAISTAVAVSPALIAFLPDSVEVYVRGICSLIVAASGTGLAINVKDRAVTGGTISQTAEGSIAPTPTVEPKAPIVPEAPKPPQP